LASVARIESGNFAAFVTGEQKSWKGRAQAGIEVSTRKRDPTTKAPAYYYWSFTSGTAITNLSNSMNSAADHIRKRFLSPKWGQHERNPGFGLRYPGPYCKHYERPLRFVLLCQVLLSSVLWALIEAMVSAYTYVCHLCGSLHFTSAAPFKRQGSF
jgi:hypothetical protein